MTTRRRVVVENGIRSVTSGSGGGGIDKFRTDYLNSTSAEDRLDILFNYYQQLKNKQGSTQQRRQLAEILNGENKQETNQQLQQELQKEKNKDFMITVGYSNLSESLLNKRSMNEEDERQLLESMKKKQMNDNEKKTGYINSTFIPENLPHQNNPVIIASETKSAPETIAEPGSPELPELVFDIEETKEVPPPPPPLPIRQSIIAEASSIWTIEQLDQIIQDLNNIKLRRRPVKSEALIRPSLVTLSPSSSFPSPSILPLQTFLLLLDF